MSDKSNNKGLPKEETPKIKRSADNAKVVKPERQTGKLLANSKDNQANNKKNGGKK